MMFNPEDLLINIAETMADELNKGNVDLHVCLFENSVNARPKKHTKKEHPVICNITERQASRGLSSLKWNQLRDKAWSLHQTIQNGEGDNNG
jgi:hypothetical protein